MVNLRGNTFAANTQANDKSSVFTSQCDAGIGVSRSSNEVFAPGPHLRKNVLRRESYREDFFRPQKNLMQ